MGDLSGGHTSGGSGGAGERAKWTLSAGAEVGGYRVVRALGRGGMGEVYEVEHEGLKKRFALKLIPPDLTGRPGFVDRFRREAQVTAGLEHPNIVRVDDVREDEGLFWLRMELIEGVDTVRFGAEGDVALRAVSLFDLARAAGGRLPEGLATLVMEQALAGLAHAHSRGVVHRDLKPANILLTEVADPPGLAAKVADFGLVKVVGEEWLRSVADASMQRSLSLGATDALDAGSSTRSLVGTYEYMSPEQRRGEELDARSDVYSMGLVAYRILTGRREIGFDLPSKVAGDIDPAWDAFLKCALDVDKAGRFADAAKMLAGLGEFSPALVGEWRGADTLRKAPARRVRIDDVIEKRLEVEEQRAELGEARDEDEAAALKSVDRELRVAREVEERDLRAACERYERAKGALAGVAERRREKAEAAHLAEEEQRARRRSRRRRIAAIILGTWAVGAILALAIIPKSEEVATWSPEEETGRYPGMVVLSRDLGTVDSVAFSPDGRHLATRDNDGTARLWSVPGGRELTRLARNESVYRVAFSPDSRYVATAGNDYSARLWSVPDGRLATTLSGHTFPIISLAFSPDGRHVAAGTLEVIIWSVPGGERVATISEHSERISCIAFSPDGRHLATGSDDHTARLWSVPDGKCVAVLTGHTDEVYSLAFSPDGRRLATGSKDYTARIWSVPDGAHVATLGHSDWVRSVAFSPDGQYLATREGTYDTGPARLWSVPDGECVATLTGHEEVKKTAAFAFSPCGRYVATAGSDGKVQLWSVPSAVCVATFPGHFGWVLSVDFRPDGRWIATGGKDGTARLWPLARKFWPRDVKAR